MSIVTASEYSKKVGFFQSMAQREPVVITSHGREETVLISAEEYRRLTRRRNHGPGWSSATAISGNTNSERDRRKGARTGPVRW